MPSTLGIVASAYVTAGASSITNISYAYKENAFLYGSNTLTIDPASTNAASGGFPNGRPNGQDKICLILIYDMSSKSRVAYSAPTGTGWTYESSKSFVASSWNFDIYTKTCGGSAGSFTTDTAYTMSTTNGWGYVVAWSYRGASSGIQSIAYPGSANNTSATFPSVTTTNTNQLILAQGTIYGGSGITSSSQTFGTTDRLNNNAGGAYTNYSIHYIQSTAGATGNKSMTLSGSSVLNTACLQIGIA